MLLSKADLLNSEDRVRAVDYIQNKLASDFDTSLPVFPVSVVSGEDILLNRWFNEQIVPLYERQQTLARDSVSRKTGVLRESVAKALEARLGRSFASSPERMKVLQATDQRLRAASGLISSVESAAIRAADSVRDLTTAALSSAALRLVDKSRNGHGRTGNEVIRAVIAEVSRDAAGEIVAEMDSLATQLRAAIVETAEALDVEVPPVDAELRAPLRDLPQIDLSQLTFEPHRAPTLFGTKIAVHTIERQLRSHIEESASAAFIAYSRVLQIWVRTAMAKLRYAFDAHADGYRAQLGRILDPVREQASDSDRLQADLDWLRGGSN